MSIIINPRFQEKNKNLSMYVKDLRVSSIRIETECFTFKSLKEKNFWRKKTHRPSKRQKEKKKK